MKRSIEPLLWGLFSAGGVMAAIFIPVLILIIGILIPFDFVSAEVFSYDKIYKYVHKPIIKMILLAIIALPFYHFAHRFYFTILHTGLYKNKNLLFIFSYGGAMSGTILAIFLLFKV